MNEHSIYISHLSCKSGNRYLLQDVDWTVESGEHWVVFGMNGSGKTTLLSIIAGFKHFSEGTVEILGAPFSNENVLNIRKRIGLVSSSFFDKHYSKESALNIVLSGKNGILGLDNNITLEDVQRAKTLLTKLHLKDKFDRTYDMFSKGEQQNILIARALMNSPDILILDEPCTGLDIYNRNYLFSTIEELSQKNNLTIIYVTHYTEEILPLFDKILFLKNGSVFAKGDISKLFNNELLSDLLGFPVYISRDQKGAYHLEVNVKSSLSDLLK